MASKSFKLPASGQCAAKQPLTKIYIFKPHNIICTFAEEVGVSPHVACYPIRWREAPTVQRRV